MTEPHGTKIDTLEQYGHIYDVMQVDNTGEIYLTTYDKKYKMNVTLHFNGNTEKYNEFINLSLQSVADTYGVCIMHEGNVIKPKTVY